MKTRLHCPYHVAVELVPQRLRRPFLNYSPGTGLNAERIVRSRGSRVVLRCPVPGCPCVAAAPGDELHVEYVVTNEVEDPGRGHGEAFA